MSLSPDDIQNLVTIAFCLEPLADKPGCTTRAFDLPDKPLTDFIIAGVNVGHYFRALAQDVRQSSTTDIFSHFVPALVASNTYKSPKTVNFGLLEIMFPVVYARLTVDDPGAIADQTVALMKRPNNRDVQHLIAARKEAWKSSAQEDKKFFTGDGFLDAASPYDFYLRLLDSYPPNNSNHQWAAQYKNGLPAFRDALACLLARPGDPLAAIAESFRRIKMKDPELKNGIIADMGCAALFVHYSFLNNAR